MALDLMTTPEPGDPVSTGDLRALVNGHSIEIMPHAAARVASFADILPKGTLVFIPYPPGSAPDDQEALAARLLGEGMVPVPHLVARSLTGRDALAERLEGLAAAGARDLLLIAGDVAAPAGPFHSTVDILDSGLLERWDFRRLRFAGHPEGLPGVAPEAVTQALMAKLAYARSHGIDIGLVTQFTFTSEPIQRWLDDVRAIAPEIDIRIGVPGPSSVRTLLSFALQCGIGNSIRTLRRRPWEVTKLARHWTPNSLLGELAAYQSERRETPVPGIHIFPFGGFQRSVRWLTSLLQDDGHDTSPDKKPVDGGPEFGRH